MFLGFINRTQQLFAAHCCGSFYHNDTEWSVYKNIFVLFSAVQGPEKYL